MPLKLLIVGSETPSQRDARRRRTGMSSCESYVETLRSLDPDAEIEQHSCIGDEALPSHDALGAFDGLFFAGSPISMHEDSTEVRSAARFMTRAFEAGARSFGSCAGLQIAAVAAGGSIAPRTPVMNAGFSRGIVATEAGRTHPLLAGRPYAWDAPAMHADIVERMPEGGTVLARSKHTPVEAAEIRFADGCFWGVQYHPEIDLGELASALRRDADSLVSQGLAPDRSAIDTYADHLAILAADPQRRDLAWLLGLDDEVTAADRRLTEIRNGLGLIRKRIA